jgi:UDP-N-acetylglucosamine--N-acetylmuramyl-(pentapeptide) pyrophosphoryl-undecaprenol N-acetylglucosamine transferase
LPSKKNHRLLIMAGGTGGHVMPALAVASKLMKKDIEIHWLGTSTGIEAKLVPQAGIPLHEISIKGLRGKGLFGWLLAPFRILKAFFQSFNIMRKLKPDTVVSMGGYVAGPGGIAAWVLRVPLIVHEQNSISGLTNRLLAPFAQKILVAFPKTFKHSKVLLTGNPVRESIVAVGQNKTIEAVGPLKILIIGGSLGAKVLNETVPKALNQLEADVNIEVWHQTGQAGLVSSQRAYAKLKSLNRVEAFIDDMAQAYQWADLVVARAGALTIAELAAAGVPSILVPFPYAVDDHQSSNARYLADAGAAILLPQKEISATKLALLINGLARQRDSLRLMAQKSHALAKPQATEQVAELCSDVVNIQN